MIMVMVMMMMIMVMMMMVMMTILRTLDAGNFLLTNSSKFPGCFSAQLFQAET